MRHGYTNRTELLGDTVLKVYDGPEASQRAVAEHRALTRLAGALPVPAVVDTTPGSLLTAYVSGEHGQDLIDLGRADAVLARCGELLRRLHALDPGRLGLPARPGAVILHGDFGPNNVLLDRDATTVRAVLDWEFSTVGDRVVDVAWCEWVVRTHHPDAATSLSAFFDAYGARPAWPERQAEMLRRCAWLEEFCRRWDPDGPGAATWRERAAAVADWREDRRREPVSSRPVTSPHPTYDQLVGLPACAEQPVPIAFEDVNGHLNVRHYTGIASEGLDESLVSVGIPPNWPAKGHACFSAEHHLTYLAELRTGDRMSARVRLLGRAERAAHALVYLLDESHQRLSFVMEEVFLHIDMSTRRTAPWPDDVAKALDERIAEHATLPWEPDVSGSLALR